MGPLDGITVVAIEQAVAAPFCTARLADAGARVIKVERPEGDFARGYDDAVPGGQSSYFVWLNRGKESVALDLTQAVARERLERLIAGADVLVQNLKPGALSRLGFGIKRLRSSYPGLICCSIAGFNDTGPLAGRKAYDLLIQAESGLCAITGGPEEPSRVGISVVDISTGATAHAAVLEALIQRGRTGQGADIRLSMFDVIADWMAVPLLNHEGGKTPKRVGLAHPSIAPYGVFATADGRQVLISIQSEREWSVLCRQVLGRPELLEDPRFASNVERVRNRADTDAAVAGAFAALEGAALIARLSAAQIAFGELNDMAGLARHPELRRAVVDTPHGPVRIPAPAVTVDGQTRIGARVPAIDEHAEDLG
ncbi:CoA transferase [Pseudooceanicola sp. 216_PA32_1]|uniref:CoA transferase n=1 Tax=Pseudooceanicola pacificus TaxID=2676438 RepID=A0A844W9P8_9RHOB|nr:CaiB/BaiF CoA-transferase family protein [Pseudooceanicola pacificus]MWB77278.1 CoA transferase [Pseudooceanicola pacificus]